MADDPTRTAFEIALRAALRDQARANATVEFLREKLGLAGAAAAPIVLGAGDMEHAEDQDPRDVGPVLVADAEFYGLSQPKAAAAFLERAGRSRPQRTEAIIAALKKGGVEFKGKDPQQTFYTILMRNPTFHRVGKGTWGLSAWYPNAARRKTTGAQPTDDPALAEVGSALDAAPETGEEDIPWMRGA